MASMEDGLDFSAEDTLGEPRILAAFLSCQDLLNLRIAVSSIPNEGSSRRTSGGGLRPSASARFHLSKRVTPIHGPYS